MSTGPDLLEFEYLQDVYRQTCEAFERGELTSSEARDLIVAVRHTDRYGAVWKVDVTRSGRRASFVRVDNQKNRSASAQVRQPHRDLDELNQQYQDICAAFDRGDISSATARAQVLALRSTDPQGRTWMIDSQRSGKNAAFIEDPKALPVSPVPTNRDAAEHHQLDTSANAQARQVRLGTEAIPHVESDDNYPVDQAQFRVKELAFVAAMLVGGLALLLGWTGEDTSSATNPPASATYAPIPTIPDAPSASYPTLASFGNRATIPNDTEIEFGRSVLNRPLTFIRRGNPNGVRVVVVGCIHGTESAGLAVTEILGSATLPSNIDLWIVPMLNPDGYAQETRQNANKVDLNRNFPLNWKPIGVKGYWQWSGLTPASEPEVKAMMNLGNIVQPQLSVWYHQDYFRISPGSGRDGDIRKTYAKLVDLPVLKIKGGSYSGTAAMWSETMNNGTTTSLTVEFGKGLREGEAQANASAITTVVNDFFPE